MKQQIVLPASYLSQQQQQQHQHQHQHSNHSKQQHKNPQNSHHSHYSSHQQAYQQFEEHFQYKHSNQMISATSTGPSLQGASSVSYQQLNQPQHQQQHHHFMSSQQQQQQQQQQQSTAMGKQQQMTNPLAVNFDQNSFIPGTGHVGSHQQQMTAHSRFSHPHHSGFHQNNKQQDMHLPFQSYPQQQQQQNQPASFSSGAASTHQQLYPSSFSQNMGRINNPLTSPQISNQWNPQSNHNSQQQSHQTQQQQQLHHIHNQNKQPSINTNTAFSSDQHPKGSLEQPEEQGKPSSVLLVIVFELKDLQITNEQIQQIFSGYGFVNKVLIFFKNQDQTKAFVEMDTIESAKNAKEDLNKAKIQLTPNQKYKFKVHYSQTPELNLCNYKTEGKDFRLQQPAVNKNINPSLSSASALALITSPHTGNQQQDNFSNQKSLTKISPVNSAVQTHVSPNGLCSSSSSSSSSNDYNPDGNPIYVQKSSITQLPSSSYSIPSPTNHTSVNPSSTEAYQKQRTSIQANSLTHIPYNNNQQHSQQQQNHHYKNISNSIGQTIGAITYVEKVQQNAQNNEEFVQQTQYNAIIAPPNTVSIQGMPTQLLNQNTTYSFNQQNQQSGIQVYNNSIHSLTSTSTPTSQGNATAGGSVNQKVYHNNSSSVIGSGRSNEVGGVIFPSDLPHAFQSLNMNSNAQSIIEDHCNLDESEYQKSPLEQRIGAGISGFGNNAASGGMGRLSGGIGNGGNGVYQGSSSLLLTKLESCESFNQVLDHGNLSSQNLPDFNLQQLGATTNNNPSNLSQSLIDISPRKGSLVLINSENVLQQSQQQENTYHSQGNQMVQLMQQNEYKPSSQTQIHRVSMGDSVLNSKSTCSTSSPSPFHTSYHGVTPPNIPNSSKISSYQQLSKLEHLQLSNVDILSNNSNNNAPTSIFNSNSNKFYTQSQQQQQQIQQQFQQQQQQQQQLLLHQQISQNQPQILSAPLIQEGNHLSLSSSNNLPFSTNNILEDANGSQSFSANTLSHQDSLENGPLQNISHLSQQQSSEESPVIYIKNVKINDLQPENIYNIFRNFGYVHSVLFLKENKTVLIQYEESSQAKMAINQLNNVNFIGDEQMRITYGKRKTIVLPNNINQKVNCGQQGSSFKSSSSQSPTTIGSSGNFKYPDYFVNRNNDPRSRAGNQNKKNTFYNPASRTVYVTNIPIQLVQRDEDLLNLFKPHGAVSRHSITKQDKKVTALVEFDTLQAALKVICFLHNTSHYGKSIQIFFTRTTLK